MRVVEQTPDRLVIEIRPVGLMVICVGLFLLFFILGFGMRLVLPTLMALLGRPEMPGLSALPQGVGMNFLGYASVIPLLVAVFLLKTRRLTFDRGRGQIGIATRGLLGRGEKTWPLADFRGASLAASRSGTNGTTYRRDGTGHALRHQRQRPGADGRSDQRLAGAEGIGPVRSDRRPDRSGGSGTGQAGDQVAALRGLVRASSGPRSAGQGRRRAGREARPSRCAPRPACSRLR
jgi:hypothetical protein